MYIKTLYLPTLSTRISYSPFPWPQPLWPAEVLIPKTIQKSKYPTQWPLPPLPSNPSLQKSVILSIPIHHSNEKSS